MISRLKTALVSFADAGDESALPGENGVIRVGFNHDDFDQFRGNKVAVGKVLIATNQLGVMSLSTKATGFFRS